MAVVLVTGASSGIGEATARALLKDRHRVFVAARRVDRMQNLVDQGATALAMDITKDEDVQRVVETIDKDAGGIEVLVNNAGFGSYGSVEETPIDDARYQFEVNLFGLARLTQLVIPGMRERGRGRIINVSSIGGRIFTPLGAWYHATKHALEGWSDCLRFELAPHGVDVVVIQPGLIATEFGDVMTGPLLARSGDGPYGKLAHALARAVRRNYEEGDGSPPTVVAEAIAQAIRAKRPKTRYARGKMARTALLLRRHLSDRMFDKALRRMG